jgi:aryl-alcohol dehydrogenase-like predicted oxidoreductase
MQYQQLGKSSLYISRISFGCMSLKPGQSDTQNIIDKAIEMGLNFFDTADLYDKGLNEINLGKALKAKRDKVIIATKVGNQWREDGSGWEWNPGKKYILESVEKSLQRLQTDHIDLYQLHGGTTDDPIDETIEAFEILKEQGKIRYYGISSIRPNVIKEYVKRSNIVSVMMQYSLLDRRPEESCLPLLQDNKIGVLVRGSVTSGLLAGKTVKPYLNYTEADVLNAVKAIQKVASSQINSAQIAIRFVLQHPATTAAAVGIRTQQHLSDAVAAVENQSLTEHELKVLRESVPANFYQEHR